MPAKRRKRSPPPNQGLAPGESLQRYLVPTRSTHSALWSWIGSEVTEERDISYDHCLAACGLSDKNEYPFCVNKFAPPVPKPAREEIVLDDDIIIISDDEERRCTKKNCKENPNCLNYLGQDKWEDEGRATRDFLKVTTVGYDPTEEIRTSDHPAGLRNLGATCYANASLQVWFRNLAFRNAAGIHDHQDSPLFQLQATFAALQKGICKVFDPTPLVESLQLRAAEQQDAQEFSKLFMSHLDVEFRKQGVPELHSLVPDQFQGSQVYGTACDSCQYRSERTTDFLEIEIRFEANSTLEDCITTMLQEEKLTGDNQYRCPECEDLQDATRYTQLTQLPPVLNFSLLRFVYDFSTMERRKSKFTLSFPTCLDMSRFLRPCLEGVNQDQNQNIYDLMGILLHKGSSAYHGHYEAQVYDTESVSPDKHSQGGPDTDSICRKKFWYQFNDEIVTKIKTLGDKKKGSKDVPITVDDDEHPSQNKRPSKKRRTVESDDDIERSLPKSSTMPKIISSKDAYMLVYVRRDYQQANPAEALEPLQQALDYVESLNKGHEEKCKAFEEKQASIRGKFTSIREQVMDVYKTWAARSVHEDCVVLSSRWLQNWLTQECSDLIKPVQAHIETEPGTTPADPGGDNPSETRLEDDIICMHRRLDPTKAKNMKRIRRNAYEKMVELTGCRHEPLLTTEDICQECVLMEFRERLYSIEHPKLVQEFDDVSEVDETAEGYWISKKWIKDWRLLKPKMHKAFQEDPAPDSLEYRGDVWCEHESLALNSLNRRRISWEGVEVLRKKFPSWEPLHGEAELCPVCDAVLHISKEDKRELRRRAEDEKALLKPMYEGTPFTEEDVSLAIVPTTFYKGWVSWVNSPADHTRADKLDNSHFLCEHNLLNFDPNCPLDTEMTISIIRHSDWEALRNLYDAGPHIGLRKLKQGEDELQYVSDIPVCEGCRLKRWEKPHHMVVCNADQGEIFRKTGWVSTDIIIQLLRGKKTETSTSRQPIATYSNKNGTRHSKRLRQARENEKRRFAVTKKTTIKDIKVKVSAHTARQVTS
ncbi:hypothetical protein NP233_g1494 [Leucocoprinus birnbaumii]|uniref:Ubiquitinyl hydrolase 1 n=1 Tax=Leucocoprinus birnbaumii TaxID=56174 RepID=A0AAD5VZU4_9AGAR|nr:hypothetical protein NP233_g1494 [Leucocoprinus birnbaumii]